VRPRDRAGAQHGGEESEERGLRGTAGVCRRRLRLASRRSGRWTSRHGQAPLVGRTSGRSVRLARMATKRPSLGRGLEALLGTATAPPAAAPAADRNAAPPSSPPREDELAYIPVDLLQRGRYQPRLDMRPESLQELADSIRAQAWCSRSWCGRSPRSAAASRCATRSSPASDAGALLRCRPARGAGRDPPRAGRGRRGDVAHREHSARELNPLEEARALDRLIREFDMTHQSARTPSGARVPRSATCCGCSSSPTR